MKEIYGMFLKWLKPIILVCCIAAVGSAAIAFLMPEYYRSNVTFLVANPHTMDRESLFNLNTSKAPVYLYGGGEDVDRILTLSKSRHVENYLIDKFDLYERYEIDSLSPTAEHAVKEALRERFQVVRTNFDNLDIVVTDKDKAFAATMANDIIQRLDALNIEVLRRKKHDILNIYELYIEDKQQEVTDLRDSLQQIAQLHPDDSVNYNLIEGLVGTAMSEYTAVKTMHEQYLPSVKTDWSTVFIVEPAVPALKRFKPVRSIIILNAVWITLLAMSIMAVFIEMFKKFEIRL